MKLETKRLIIRKPRLSDWKDVVEGVSPLNVSKWTTRIPYPYHKKDAVSWLNDSIKKWKKEGYTFLIELKSEKKVIGCIGLHDLNKFEGVAVTGSWINEKYWRKGYITEAKIVVNNFAFNKLKLRKLNSMVCTKNIASNKTQKRMGYKLEGCKKKDTRSLATGKIHDANLYGLLKEDWKKNVSKVKKRLDKKRG